MPDQPSLFDYRPGRGRRPPQKTIQARFEEFHQHNPHIYEELLKMARQWRDQGYEHCSIRMLWGVLRFRVGVRTIRSIGDFKLNDHYHSRYARMLMERNPDLADFFELRELKAA